jgi:lipid-binding SYLF domain-containing protein
MKKLLFTSLAICCLIFVITIPAQAGWDPTKSETPKQQGVPDKDIAVTIDAFKAKDPTMQTFFDKAYGYAVFPNVGKGAFFVGGAYGEGKVYEKGNLIGTSELTQVTVGFQAGGQAYSEIIFFKDKKTLNDFKAGKFKLGAQASAVAATSGASANVDYSEGVAIFTMTKGGLMLEASVGGQKFSFKPLAKAKEVSR